MDFQDGVLGVLLVAEQSDHFRVVQALLQQVELLGKALEQLLQFVAFAFFGKLQKGRHVVAAVLQLLVPGEVAFDAAFFLEHRRQGFRIAPGIGLGEVLFDVGKTLGVALGVKDAPRVWRSGRRGPGSGGGDHSAEAWRSVFLYCRHRSRPSRAQDSGGMKGWAAA